MAQRKSLRHPLSARELREAFVTADQDQDGRIDFAEFEQRLVDLEAGMSKQDLEIGFREVDTDHDGLIDPREFMEWWRSD
ncbi:MAG TPA: EF-hand domain-containing protein [Steroidobacteraceae bacterium]|nr:EF-hand domain-containing protein [Steroidobacteraceae bacterium]